MIHHSCAACERTHCASVRAPKPVAPPFLGFHTGPAMSRCAQGVFFTNSARKSAAVMEPPSCGVFGFVGWWG